MAEGPEKGTEPAGEDVKRRFREALERKQAKGRRDASAGGSGSGGGGKAHDAHGPASTQRTFRRKSG